MNDKKRCLYINGEEVTVTEEVYKEYMKPVWREKKMAQKGWRCRLSNGRRCRDNCDECEFARLAEGPLGTIGSLDFLEEVGDQALIMDYDISEHVVAIEEKNSVMAEIMKMDEESQKIIALLVEGYTHQEIADIQGVTRSDISHRLSVIRKKLKKFRF